MHIEKMSAMVSCVVDSCCQIADCRKVRLNRGYCKDHETLNFILKFKSILKERFGSIESGLLVLEDFSGTEVSDQDLSSFLNFLNCPFDLEELKRTVKHIGKSRQNQGSYITKISNIRESLRSPAEKPLHKKTKLSLFEVFLRQAVNQPGRNIQEYLDDEGNIHARTIAEGLKLDEETMSMYFNHYFAKEFASLQEFLKTLKPKTASVIEIVCKLQVNQTPEIAVLVIKFIHTLRETFSSMSEAYNAICSGRSSTLNYFKVQRSLKRMGLEASDHIVKEIIEWLGEKGTFLPYFKFKQLWTGKLNVCKKSDCLLVAFRNSEYCKTHNRISKTNNASEQTRNNNKSNRFVRHRHYSLRNSQLKPIDLKIMNKRTASNSSSVWKESNTVLSFLRKDPKRSFVKSNFSKNSTSFIKAPGFSKHNKNPEVHKNINTSFLGPNLSLKPSKSVF